ncbi:hypothetical protein J6590_054637 [Homalodisca vitripennis]|nr:hypothetical protein J6590_054637 [Homalodisca vitripennis]
MGLGHALSRRKALDTVEGEQSELGKVLSTVDLIALGVGSTLGVGVYVLPGIVSRDIAGPGVVLSFLYAAIVSVLAGLCYAEFGARVPKAGSAYIYSYVTIGEFVAYIIGWNLIIEYVIAGASVARGVSLYLDSLFGNAMANYFRSIYAMDVPFLSGYIDFFAFSIAVLVSVFLAVGVKESLLLNNLLTTVNCTVVVFVIIIGSLYADFMNWEIPSSNVPLGSGEGGFLPYGWLGTLRGASTCFYGFVGFDVIATSGEETRNPRRAIPVSIIVSLLIIFLAYFGVSSVLTLMWPYYLQDVGAPLPHVFTELGLDWAKWVVTIGGLFGLSASLFGGMFPLPRVVYAMSQDGLLFEFLSRVHPRFKTPFVGTIFSGILTGVAVACCSKYRSARLSTAAPSACGTNSPLSPRFSSSRSAWTHTISSTLTLLNNRTLTLNTKQLYERDYLEQQGLLTNSRHGFVNGRSTITEIAELAEFICDQLEAGKFLTGKMLDFSKKGLDYSTEDTALNILYQYCHSNNLIVIMSKTKQLAFGRRRDGIPARPKVDICATLNMVITTSCQHTIYYCMRGSRHNLMGDKLYNLLQTKIKTQKEKSLKMVLNKWLVTVWRPLHTGIIST